MKPRIHSDSGGQSLPGFARFAGVSFSLSFPGSQTAGREDICHPVSKCLTNVSERRNFQPAHQLFFALAQVLTKPVTDGKSKDGKDKEIPIPEIRMVPSYEQDYRANFNRGVTYIRSESSFIC